MTGQCWLLYKIYMLTCIWNVPTELLNTIHASFQKNFTNPETCPQLAMTCISEQGSKFSLSISSLAGCQMLPHGWQTHSYLTQITQVRTGPVHTSDISIWNMLLCFLGKHSNSDLIVLFFLSLFTFHPGRSLHWLRGGTQSENRKKYFLVELWHLRNMLRETHKLFLSSRN